MFNDSFIILCTQVQCNTFFASRLPLYMGANLQLEQNVQNNLLSLLAKVAILAPFTVPDAAGHRGDGCSRHPPLQSSPPFWSSREPLSLSLHEPLLPVLLGGHLPMPTLRAQKLRPPPPHSSSYQAPCPATTIVSLHPSLLW